ncbi:hypothetical protein HMPREF9996_00212 [Aggregatibacter actinomycetemcomitans Y4]|nr:hypothetical protein HMPREF9996_00212 [Aggregatibacter actinomycetemcomitans Y4]
MCYLERALNHKFPLKVRWFFALFLIERKCFSNQRVNLPKMQ